MRLILIFLFSICLITCKNKENKSGSGQNAPEPNLQEIKMPAPAMGKLDDAFIKRADAQKSIPDLEDQIWHYTYGLSLKETTPKDNIFKGQWLDLLPKGLYKKGLYRDTTENGRFIYDEATTILEMRSTSGTSTEWKVKVDPSHMILIGTSKYGNNPWQIKLSRRDSLPNKQ